MALVSPYFECKAVELTGIIQILEDMRDYISGIRLPLPRNQVIETRLLSGMNLDQLRVLCNSHCLSAARNIIQHLVDNNLKMEIIGRNVASHTPLINIIGSNSFDNPEDIQSE